MRVFIADDSAIVCGRLITLLSDVENIEIIGFAQNSADAYTQIRSLRPDAVILDIRMPGGSGVEALKRIKAELPHILVIMFTNYPYAQYSDLCTAAGADYFFDKTAEFHRIPEVLAELHNRRAAELALAAAHDELLPNASFS